MAPLTGKVALITGASRGIGRAIAQRLAADGASVVINYASDRASADSLVAEIGADRALAVQADAGKVADIARLVDAAVEKFGKIDILLPNAGISRFQTLAEVTEADYDAVFDLNVKGPLFLAQKAATHIPRGGRVIFVSTGVTSFSSVRPNYVVYAASKGAVEQYVRVLSKEFGPKGITVNAVAPGPTGTELYYEGKSQELLDMMNKMSPFDRIATVEEQANVVAFLASEGAAWVSGQTIRVNGATMV